MMTVLNNASNSISISMCGDKKFARHNFDAFDTLPECEKDEELVVDKDSSECKVA